MDGIKGSLNNVANGTPQGSPVSPILSVLYTSDLLRMFEHNKVVFNDLSSSPLEMAFFVDDGSLRVASPDIGINVRSLQRAYDIVHNWMEDNKLKLDPSKRELIHFHRNRNRQGIVDACTHGH